MGKHRSGVKRLLLQVRRAEEFLSAGFVRAPASRRYEGGVKHSSLTKLQVEPGRGELKTRLAE